MTPNIAGQGGVSIQGDTFFSRAHLNLEQVYTTEAGFNVQGATPLQRAVSRVAQGLPVGDLASHPDVRAGFGGPEAVARLPVGAPPAEMHIVGPSRSGKSRLLAADALCASQNVDVEGTDIGDVVRVSILGLGLRTNAIWKHLCEIILARAALRRLLIGDIQDGSFALRHPTGRPIEYMQVPLDKWGGAVVSDFSAGCYPDEEPRMIGAEHGVKNWNSVHDSVVGRLRPGAKFLGAGAPWAPQGPIFDIVGEYFGKPSAEMVVVRGTGPMWNPAWWTPKRCSALELRNPTAYRSDVLAEFIDRVSSIFTQSTLQANTRTTGNVSPQDCSPYRAAGIDPSDAEGGNGFVLCIVDAAPVEGDPNGAMRFRVVFLQEWRHCGVETAWRESAEWCAGYGISVAVSDKYAGKANVALAARYGLEVLTRTRSTTETVDDFVSLQTYFSTGAMEIPPDPTLRRDLLGVRKIATPTGFRIDLPKTSDGRHADTAPALVAALDSAIHDAAQAHCDLRLVTASDGRTDRGGRAGETWVSGESMTTEYLPDGSVIVRFG